MSLRTVAPLPRELLRRHVGRRPATCRRPAVSSVAATASPKSVMRTRPRPSIMTLAGFRSRCSTPRSCAAASPAQSCRAISSALSFGEIADALQQRRQVLAVDVLHRQEVLPVDLADVVDAADVRMRELPRDADFGEEALAADRIARQRARQELQRDRLSELEVVGAVDLAHAAAAEQADDAVAVGEDDAGGEPTDGNRIGGDRPRDVRPATATSSCRGCRELRRRGERLAACQAETALRRNDSRTGWALHEVAAGLYVVSDRSMLSSASSGWWGSSHSLSIRPSNRNP